MSAFGPKQTSLVALHMSAFGGKADMPIALRCWGEIKLELKQMTQNVHL
jgi:hypothetical protein